MKLRMTKRTALLGLVAAALIIPGVKATSADSAQSATGVSIPQAAQMDLQSGVNPFSPSTVTTSTTPYAPSGGNWQNIGGDWRWAANGTGLQIASTWAKINGHIYHFESTGWMNTGWYKEDGTWYYFQPSGGYAGALHTAGWLKLGETWYYLDPTTGKMIADTEKIINGKLYLFDIDGKMKTGWVSMSQGWRYIDALGDRVFGWLKLNGTWYYLDPSTGIMQTGRRAINGTTYVFNASGAMSTGWTKLKEGWRYSDSNGVEYLGWLGLNGVWYYLDPSNGVMVENASKSIGGKTYTFDANGAMLTGWVEMSDGWHYATTLGDEVHGWLNDRGTWYYLDPVTGIMATGERTIGGNSYEFASNGAMLTGWYKRADGWHYRKPSGEVGLGWQRVGLDWYYLEPSTGIMANAGRTIDGKWYNFLSSGQWVNYQAPAGYLQPTMSIQSLGWATNNLTYGMNGVKVRIVQQRLGIWHTMKLASVDSSFMSAVRNFQRRAGLPQTGVVDERTWNAMGTGYSWYVDQYQVAPTVSVSASRSEHIEAMISYALAQVGSPYTWGGAGPYNLGFDCSGLVLQALHAGGLDPQPINVLKHAWPDYRTSQELYNYSGFQYLPLSQRQRGDLIFYTSGGVVTHVSLYLGNERVVHTDWMGNPARVDSVWTSYGYSNTAPWVIRPFP